MTRYLIIGLVFLCAGILISYAADRTDTVIVKYTANNNTQYTNTTDEHLTCYLTLYFDETGKPSPDFTSPILLDTTGWTRTFYLSPHGTYTYFRQDASFFTCINTIDEAE